MIICDSSVKATTTVQRQGKALLESGWANATFLYPRDQLKRIITIFLSSNVSLNESLKKTKQKVRLKKKNSFSKCQILMSSSIFF